MLPRYMKSNKDSEKFESSDLLLGEKTLNKGSRNDEISQISILQSDSRESLIQTIFDNKVKTNNSSLLFDVKQLEMEAEKKRYISMYGHRDPLDISDLSGQQVDLVPINMTALPETVWDFCVGYAAIAMGRKGTATDTINIGINKTTPIGLYYLAALTLFYSIEEASVGRIPPIQRMDKKLREMLYAVAPVNKQGKAYTARWDDSVQDLISTRPYHSFTNPLITLAPHSGAAPNGDPILAPETAKPMITLDDIREIGPEAFELVQRYFLADDGSRELVSYTMEGPMSNTSMFAVPRNASAVNPVKGFGQFVNETGLPQRDVWLISLAFFENTNLRDGWNAKTVQLGTHLALFYLLKGNEHEIVLPTKSQTHMINFSTLLMNSLGSAITAELNSSDDQDFEDIVTMVTTAGTVDFGYLSRLGIGQLLRHLLAVNARRFWLGSALCTGTPMPDELSTVIGAGSRYLTTNNVDEQVLFGADVEELAGLSSFISMDGILSIPVLTIRGAVSSLNLGPAPAQPDVSWLFNRMFPQFASIPYSYLLADDGPENVVQHTTDFCYTTGANTDEAMRTTSAIFSMLQPYNTIADATGSRDGQDRMMLYLTHYLQREEILPDTVDRTPLFQVNSALSTQPFDPRHTANVFTSLFPVMIGTDSIQSAYQVLLWRKYSIAVEQEYAAYRAPVIFQRGHKRASNIEAPSEWGAFVAHRTMVGEGGNFLDGIFKDGGVLDSAKAIAQGIMDVIAPDKDRNWVRKKGLSLSNRNEVLKAVSDGHIHPMHLAPITHKVIGVQEYVDAVAKIQTPEFQKSRRIANSSKVIKVSKPNKKSRKNLIIRSRKR